TAPAVVEGAEPYQPDVLILVEAGSGFVFGSEVVKPDASHDVVAAWAEERLVPGVSLRVEDEGLAEALRKRLGPDHAVRVGPIPELRAPLAALNRFMGRPSAGGEEAPRWTDEASPEARILFYEAAERFERAAPWELADDGQILSLDAPALGWEGACVSILGAAGEEFGLLLLRSLEDYIALARLSDRELSGGRRWPGIPILSVNFDHPENLTGGEAIAKKACSLGWKPGNTGRLAYLLKVDAQGATPTLATEDYGLATACMEAVRAFFEENRRLFRRPPKKNVTTRSRIAMPVGDVEVRVTAPPEDLPWAWGEEEPIEGLRRGDVVTVREAFRDARRAAGASEEEAEKACMVVHDALQYKAKRGEPVERWTADDVEKYLLGHYPARGGAPDEELELVPLHLDAFLEWLAASGGGEPGPLRTARDRLARCRHAFLRDARDPKLFGPAKTLVRAMQREGVDPTDRRATDRFIAKFNERALEDPSILPMLDPAPRRRKLWVWTPGQPAPDPRGPCPCGSGKRYRKCCMPR
ncbi:MAG TPA: SEC-C domain-containing protein, partial [Vicinamibacteria bacterium]|nr:SEC-C domain-containing protein [Vicinamibacteria bacterium]